MKNIAQSLGNIVFSLSALSMLSAIELLNLPPALAATEQYFGKDADVSVRCDTVSKQSYANFTINGTKTNTKIIAALGNAYFNDNIATSQIIAVTRPPTETFDGSGYFHTGYAQKFSSALAAAGIAPNNAVISLPDLSKFPSKALGYDVNCPLVNASNAEYELRNMLPSDIERAVFTGNGWRVLSTGIPGDSNGTWVLYYTGV
jgi:hypothetical protein